MKCCCYSLALDSEHDKSEKQIKTLNITPVHMVFKKNTKKGNFLKLKTLVFQACFQLGNFVISTSYFRVSFFDMFWQKKTQPHGRAPAG